MAGTCTTGDESARQKALLMLGDATWRLTHTAAVAKKAAQARESAVGPCHLVPAAWLHDVGYAPSLASSGFHPLDGARFLEREGVDPRIVALVAHHSCARYEAAERGLIAELNKYPREESLVADALTWADMTTGPTGETVTFEERLAEILQRYPPDDPVHRAMLKAKDELAATVARVEERLKNQRNT